MYHVLSIKYLTKIFSLSTLASCFLLLATASPAGAQALSLAVDPPIITINAIPPTNITSSLSIENKGDEQVTLQIQIKPFTPKGENGELEHTNETLEVFKNIQILDTGLPVNSIILGPKQQKSLNLSIVVPQDTTISDYYFSVIFVSTDSLPIESDSSKNQIGIATNILLSVGAKEIPKATIEEFSSSIFLGSGPVPFTVKVRNSGTHFIKPKGTIIIKNMFGQSIGKLDLTSVNILSDSTRAIPNDIYIQELKLQGENAKGKNSFNFTHPIALWKENFLLGLYTATLNIAISDEGPIFTRATHFLAFPFQGLIMVGIIGISIIIIINRLKLYMRRNQGL